MSNLVKIPRRGLSPFRQIRFWLSPAGLAVVGVAPLFISVTIPPSVYAGIVHEPDLMFLNIKLISFTLLCAAAFILGTLIFGIPSRGLPAQGKLHGGNANYAWAVMAGLVFATLLSLTSTATILIQSGDVLGRILSGGGSAVKGTLDTTGAFAESLPLLVAVIWWASARYGQSTQGPAWALVRVVLWTAIASALLGAAVKLARYEIIPLAIGLFIILARTNLINGKMSWARISAYTLVAPLLLVGIFLLFSALRGQTTIIEQLSSLFGYGPASYNRLSLMLDGGLQYPYAGNYYYAFGFLEHVPVLHNVIDLGQALGMPDRRQAFLSEFSAIKRSGLKESFIWSTAFGYYYADLGKWIFLYMFSMGAIAELAFRAWWKGTAFGLVFYPFMAVSILLWGSTNLLVQPRLLTYLGVAVVLTFVDRAFMNARNFNPRG